MLCASFVYTNNELKRYYVTKAVYDDFVSGKITREDFFAQVSDKYEKKKEYNI